MNNLKKYSASLYKKLQTNFPGLEAKYQEISGLIVAEFPCSTNTAMGGIIVQMTDDNSIWLRIHPPYSAYCVNSSQELIKIMQSVIKDEILWAIGFSGEEWAETTLVRQKNDLQPEPLVKYQLYSWSGKLDEVLPPKL